MIDEQKLTKWLIDDWYRNQARMLACGEAKDIPNHYMYMGMWKAQNVLLNELKKGTFNKEDDSNGSV